MTDVGPSEVARRVAAVVLAGGKSARFGRDKATEPFEGSTLVERAVLVARSIASDVVVVAATGQSLPEMSVQVVRDAEAFPGPLVALARGVAALPPGFDVVLAIAVDMPRLRGDVLSALVAACPRAGAAVPAHDGALQPLSAAYSREAALGLGSIVAQGIRSMHGFLERIPVTVVPSSELSVSDAALALSDADTPDALERLRGR